LEKSPNRRRKRLVDFVIQIAHHKADRRRDSRGNRPRSLFALFLASLQRPLRTVRLQVVENDARGVLDQPLDAGDALIGERAGLAFLFAVFRALKIETQAEVHVLQGDERNHHATLSLPSRPRFTASRQPSPPASGLPSG